jgi:hypothetical protein
VSLVCDSEPEANIDKNVKESDQVRFIDRNLKILTSIFFPDFFFI